MRISKVLYSFAIFMFAVSFIGCSENSSQKYGTDNVVTNTKPVVLPIKGMSCMACVAKVRNTLSDLGGINAVDVNLENNNVTFRYNPQKISLKKIKQAIEKAGYKAGTPKELPE